MSSVRHKALANKRFGLLVSVSEFRTGPIGLNPGCIKVLPSLTTLQSPRDGRGRGAPILAFLKFPGNPNACGAVSSEAQPCPVPAHASWVERLLMYCECG